MSKALVISSATAQVTADLLKCQYQMQLSEDLQLNKKNLYQTVNQKKTRFLEVMDKRIVYKFFKDFTHNIKKIQNRGKR